VGFYYGARLYNPKPDLKAEDAPELIELFRSDLHGVEGEIRRLKRSLERDQVTDV
jgi:hypothetical protein